MFDKLKSKDVKDAADDINLQLMEELWTYNPYLHQWEVGDIQCQKSEINRSKNKE